MFRNTANTAIVAERLLLLVFVYSVMLQHVGHTDYTRCTLCL